MLHRRHGGRRNTGKKLVNKRSTDSFREFATMIDKYPNRTSIVSTGDSWFAYPPKTLVGKASNIIDHFIKLEKFNFLEMAKNGDEVVDMLSGSKKFDLIEAVADNDIDFVLFSGGGNDLVGSFDFHYILNYEGTGTDPINYFHPDRFQRKLNQIKNAYEDLIDYCILYSKNPELKILTHSYGYAIPTNKKASHVFGLVRPEPWMYPALYDEETETAKIPKARWNGMVKYMINSLKNIFEELHQKHPNKFYFVDSTSLITKNDWRDEIHLTGKAYKKVAKAMHNRLCDIRNT